MFSNSKLTPQQKAERKELLAELPDGATFANSSCGVTVLCVPDSPTLVAISTAIMSADETKFRRKVGQYHALVRYNYGIVTILPRDVIPDAASFVLAVFGEYTDE